jgi:hypothetical protein
MAVIQEIVSLGKKRLFIGFQEKLHIIAGINGGVDYLEGQIDIIAHGVLQGFHGGGKRITMEISQGDFPDVAPDPCGVVQYTV